MFELRRHYRFEAAHKLPAVPPEHPCARLHGHTYEVTVGVRGEAEPETGWVIDYGAIDDACGPVLEEIDHRLLNDVPGLENPTSERLAIWLWERISPVLAGLDSVTVGENPDSTCHYWGPHRPLR
jgi:6-pyruvoyltetrahydropterin/6-carboxytetrahydropterin synthase